MPFQPRTFEEIFTDQSNYVRSNTRLTDWNVGSLIRTVLESTSLEDDETYFQMVELLDSFRITEAIGTKLDARAADFNEYRRAATYANGYVTIINTNITSSMLAVNAPAGSTSITVESGDVFPDSGNLRIGEKKLSEEEIAYTSKTGNVLNLAAPLVHNHLGTQSASIDNASRVAFLVPGAVDIILYAGIGERRPPLADDPAVGAVTLEDVVLRAGDYLSPPILSAATSAGEIGNIKAGEITEFTSNPPFDGADVTNTLFSGGLEEETDDEFRERLLAKIQGLAKATVISLESALIGVSDQAATLTIKSARTVEKFSEDRVDVLFWTGVDKVETELVPATPGDVETLTDNADPGQRFFKTLLFPVVEGSEQFYLNGKPTDPTPPQALVPGQDYIFYGGAGWVELLLNNGSGLVTGDKLYVQYRHYVGITEEAQKILNGLRNDPVAYPGVRAAGVRVYAKQAIPAAPFTVRASISVLMGFDKDDVLPLVEQEMVSYLSQAGVGEDWIEAEAIERGMSVDGMFDVAFLDPGGNVLVDFESVIDPTLVDVLVS